MLRITADFQNQILEQIVILLFLTPSARQLLFGIICPNNSCYSMNLKKSGASKNTRLPVIASLPNSSHLI